MSMGDKKGKGKPLKKGEMNIFEVFSMGIKTNRAEWVYNFSRPNLESNMRFMIDNYNKEVAKKETDSTYKPTMDKTKIRWTENLLKYFEKGLTFDFNDSGLIVETIYRPFCKNYLYISQRFNERLGFILSNKLKI